MGRAKRSRSDQRSCQEAQSEVRDRTDALLSRREAIVPPAKRARFHAASDIGASYSDSTASKPWFSAAPATDCLSALSDELLIRILACLSPRCLLRLAPVSRRFHRLADDSQLWKAIYHDRFVRPRVMRVPGFRGGATASAPKAKSSAPADTARLPHESADVKPSSSPPVRVLNWKQQYKLRHNWARGKCAVKELRLEGNYGEKHVLDLLDCCNQFEGEHEMIVKVVDGIAVTADWKRGLRVWDLKSRSLVVSTPLSSCTEPEAVGSPRIPASLAADAAALGGLSIAIGFLDGGFEIWQCDLLQKSLTRRYTHLASGNGSLTGIIYSHPYVLTATNSVLVSLYVFAAGRRPGPRALSTSPTGLLSPPHLLTSLQSHTSRPPLALSIRRMATVVVASIAYTLFTPQGWSIGIQDMHVKVDGTGGSVLPTVVTTQLAYSHPMNSSRRRNNQKHSSARTSPSRHTMQYQDAPSPGSLRSRMYGPDLDPSGSPTPAHHDVEDQDQDREEMDGPIALCYSHPYLLATMPDNTLILHLCTSSASSLAISPGVRLWGHTSGISDAKITARGKAVSVSMRGEEMRVWELEGRPAAERGQSIAIRPNAAKTRQEDDSQADVPGSDWDERRNWVGFDDEMVIVLKQSRGGQESLLVYDFT